MNQLKAIVGSEHLHMGRIVTVFESPLGKMELCSDGTSLTAVTFTGQKYEKRHIPEDAVFGSCAVLEQAKVWLAQYFRGKSPVFSLPMKPNGTPFQRKVWEALLEIPYGKTIPYGELARKVGCRSAQAVGGAVGKNPISILIPCHRVVGADGSLIGYAGGVEKKEFLLALEKHYG